MESLQAEKEKAEKALAEALMKAAYHEQHHLSWKQKAHEWASNAQRAKAAATPIREVRGGDAGSANGEEPCANCGALMPPQMKFCTSCGTKRGGNSGGNASASGTKNAERNEPANDKNPPEEMKCENCNATLRPGLRFCTSCGTKVVPKSKAQLAGDGSVDGGASGGSSRSDSSRNAGMKV